MELYWGSGSQYAWRVMLALLLKGLDFDDHLLSFSDREHKQPGYLALNPRGKVPALVDGDVVVRESIAILAYLESSYPRPPLFGATRADTARIWRKVIEIDGVLLERGMPAIRALFFGRWTHDVPELRGRVADVRAELDRHEDEAEEGPLNAVDCMLVPALRSLERASRKAGASELGLLPFELTRWPRLAERLAAVEALPGYARTWPPHWS